MHLRSYILGDVSFLPTKRNIRRIRRRVPLPRAAFQRLLLLLASLLFLLYLLCRRHHPPATRPLLPPATDHGLSGCFHAPIAQLSTFDPFARAEKAAGKLENDFENRWQEDVWDTLLHNHALFPAWSDMRWNVPQYARALSHDLALVQALAVAALRPAALGIQPRAQPFQSAASPVRVNYVHHRLDRLRGLQYAVNFALRDARPNTTTYNLLVEKPLDHPACRVSLGNSISSEPVYILLPYKDREARLRLFFQNYVVLRTQYAENLILIVSVLRADKEDGRTVRALKSEVFGDEFSEVANSVWIHENDGDIEHGFSRGVALREAAKLAPSPNSVIFHCDVDMIIHPTFFDRCRHNTALGSQVYYPVFYSLYPYANAQPTIVERNGFWRKTSFGMTCIRKGDFEIIGAYDDAETRFHGWGSEDVYQFEKIRNATGLVAFRAVEPSLMHRWHSKACDNTSDAYVDCMKTNFMAMGHPLRIGPLLLESLQNVDEFFSRLEHS